MFINMSGTETAQYGLEIIFKPFKIVTKIKASPIKVNSPRDSRLLPVSCYPLSLYFYVRVWEDVWFGRQIYPLCALTTTLSIAESVSVLRQGWKLSVVAVGHIECELARLPRL